MKGKSKSGTGRAGAENPGSAAAQVPVPAPVPVPAQAQVPAQVPDPVRDPASDPVSAPAPAAAPAEDPAAESEGLVLEDWTPLHRCLDFQLGQVAFQQRGAQAFTSQQVPNLINQGGLSAYRAAEVLFAHCVELDAAGELERDIQCLEMAIGLGLFSLQLLDRFASLCSEHGRDYYDRLTWFATDGTPRMVQDAQRNGVFERHAGHVVLGLVDALDPARLVRIADGATVDLTGRLRAVFHTYLLCVLPANLFRRQRTATASGTVQDSWGAVMARTVLANPKDLPLFSNRTPEQLQQLAANRTQQELAELVPLYPLIDLQLTLAAFEPADLSEGPELRRIADAVAAGLGRPAAEVGQEPEITWVLHSAGAQHSLARQLETLRPTGFVLYRDYGPATAERANGNHLYQHYGATTAAGINHFALDGWLAMPDALAGPGAQVSVPPGEGEASIKTRLVSRAPLPATRQAFALHFDQRAFDRLEAIVARAREQVGQAGESPLDTYRLALQVERDNWLLLGEAGDIALRRDRNFELAHVLLTEALRINPWYAAGTWNTLGDLFWARQEWQQARLAYERATQANPEQFRGWLNLADCCVRQGDWPGAIEMAAKAMARDVDGEQADRAQALLIEAAKRLELQRSRAATLRKQRQAGAPR